VRRPAGDLEGLRAATRRLLRTVDALTDDGAREPSRLPEWNRAEVLTHVARNADGIRGMLDAAARGEVAAMYPSVEARAAGIAAGRDEPAAFVRTDLRRACDALMESFTALPDDAWDRVGVASVKRTMRELAWVRLREVEVHHVDLGLGYEPSDWPVHFVSRALDEVFSTLGSRASGGRPLGDATYRIVSTDHETAWRVTLRDDDVLVGPDDRSPVEGEARGWGCDVLAWMYGRDARGAGVTASGDLTVLRLPQWFPFG
jgi:maleylpyruvate isomerase